MSGNNCQAKQKCAVKQPQNRYAKAQIYRSASDDCFRPDGIFHADPTILGVPGELMRVLSMIIGTSAAFLFYKLWFVPEFEGALRDGFLPAVGTVTRKSIL